MLLGSRVVGVAIEVPEPWNAQLTEARARFDDPVAPRVSPHITVLAPTVVPRVNLDRVLAHLDQAAAECSPFEVRLRGTATFRPVSPVVFVAVVEGISGCEQVERAVRSGVLLRRRPFPYHPHVTVAHDVSDDILNAAYDDLDGFSARFRADSFTLSEQGVDGSWSVIANYELTGAALTVARSRRD
ncbi:MAG: 2'-5' RNA ligase family protein [Actinobacteria bacterium]|uniref:Unannotated protein n=1 Tax=freshwater metagenome TaxID=449393 RepID=A0A6J7P473_9ZZZZ|nr:2'-5' RNA ligase family protein [Actinomycetota bacterium]MSW42188.1 2'-5' RNA ligase family protein [Actinomycetota bacterium]